jgi:hypothetical protein
LANYSGSIDAFKAFAARASFIFSRRSGRALRGSSGKEEIAPEKIWSPQPIYSDYSNELLSW